MRPSDHSNSFKSWFRQFLVTLITGFILYLSFKNLIVYETQPMWVRLIGWFIVGVALNFYDLRYPKSNKP